MNRSSNYCLSDRVVDHHVSVQYIDLDLIGKWIREDRCFLIPADVSNTNSCCIGVTNYYVLREVSSVSTTVRSCNHYGEHLDTCGSSCSVCQRISSTSTSA